MFKKGRYALYKGKEYSIIYAKNGLVKLRSFDSSDTANGFLLSPTSITGVYVKTVGLEDLDDAFEIIPSAFYKGYDFGIIGFDKESQEAILMTSNPEAWKKLNLETHAKYEFTVCAPINDLDVIEEKVEILGFRRN